MLFLRIFGLMKIKVEPTRLFLISLCSIKKNRGLSEGSNLRKITLGFFDAERKNIVEKNIKK